MRTLAPAETLVYLETNDLAAALKPIVDSKAFNEAAKRKPDLSALQGVQLVVAVTGFETTEEKLTEEHSVGRVQPILLLLPTHTHGIIRRSVLPNESSVRLLPRSTIVNRRWRKLTNTAENTLPGLPKMAVKPTLSSSTASFTLATTNRRSTNASPSAAVKPTAC
jgi:hypothetical protein